MKNRDQLLKSIRNQVTYILMFLFVILITSGYHALFLNKMNAVEEEVEEAVVEPDKPEVVDGIHVETGLIAEGDYVLIVRNCTGCHSAALVTQNKQTKEGWLELIRWMQETQKLWDLGKNEDKILDYLSTYYAPKDEGRRKNLVVEEWYEIK